MTCFPVVDRKVLRKPIYGSVPWLNPLCLLITGAFLLVVLVVSLAVALTKTGQPTIMSNVTWSQVGTDVKGTDYWEDLGESVALSANGNELRAAGNAFLQVYLLAGADGWVRDRDLSYSSGDTLSIFGTVSVSLDGSTIVESDSSTGRVLVSRRVGAVWEQCGDWLVYEDKRDQFGWSVALSSNGSVIAVGSQAEYVKVYQNKEEACGNFTLVTRIEGDTGSKFGFSLAMSADADRLIVGAPHADDDAGAAITYSLFPEPALLQRMNADEPYDLFGWSVAASSNGDVLAAGSYSAAYAKVYVADDSSRRRYSQLADRVNGTGGSYFGEAMSLSGDGTRLAVGAQWDDQNGFSSGRVFVYAVHPRWHQKIGEFGGDAPGDHFGHSVSLSGNGTRLAVGNNPYEKGFVRVFESA